MVLLEPEISYSYIENFSRYSVKNLLAGVVTLPGLVSRPHMAGGKFSGMCGKGA